MIVIFCEGLDVKVFVPLLQNALRQGNRVRFSNGWPLAPRLLSALHLDQVLLLSDALKSLEAMRPGAADLSFSFSFSDVAARDLTRPAYAPLRASPIWRHCTDLSIDRGLGKGTIETLLLFLQNAAVRKVRCDANVLALPNSAACSAKWSTTLREVQLIGKGQNSNHRIIMLPHVEELCLDGGNAAELRQIVAPQLSSLTIYLANVTPTILSDDDLTLRMLQDNFSGLRHIVLHYDSTRAHTGLSYEEAIVKLYDIAAQTNIAVDIHLSTTLEMLAQCVQGPSAASLIKKASVVVSETCTAGIIEDLTIPKIESLYIETEDRCSCCTGDTSDKTQAVSRLIRVIKAPMLHTLSLALVSTEPADFVEVVQSFSDDTRLPQLATVSVDLTLRSDATPAWQSAQTAIKQILARRCFDGRLEFADDTTEEAEIVMLSGLHVHDSNA